MWPPSLMRAAWLSAPASLRPALMEFLGIGSCCRASVAIYNTAEDVDALLENLENVRKVMGL